MMPQTLLPGYDDVLTNAAFAPVLDGARVLVTGPDARDFLHRMTTNDILGLGTGKGARAALLDINGRMLADLHAWVLDEETVLVETDAQACDTLIGTLEKYIIMERVEVEDARDSLGLVTVQGVEAFEPVLEALLEDMPPLEPFAVWKHGDGADAVIVCARDRTGHGGYDLYASPERAAALPQALGPAGATVLSEAALEALRIEAGIAKWGRELTEGTIPLEANLEGVSVSFTKGCYPGQEIIARIHSLGKPARRLLGIRFEGEEVPSSCVVERDGAEAGAVTSAVLSPRFGPIAMAYLKKDYAEPGVAVRCGGVQGMTCELPFGDQRHAAL
jgi:folate-binding protein YgfZ